MSPITGEKIPASKMQEHMRIGLLDPRWLEQRDRSIREKQSDDEVYAPGECAPHRARWGACGLLRSAGL